MWDFSIPLSIADKIRWLKMSRNLEDGKNINKLSLVDLFRAMQLISAQ